MNIKIFLHESFTLFQFIQPVRLNISSKALLNREILAFSQAEAPYIDYALNMIREE